MCKKPVVLICVSGGSGSGKTTVAEEIKKICPKKIKLLHLSLDRFYKSSLNNLNINDLHSNVNFDHPKSFDWVLIKKVIKDLINRKPIKVPYYDYKKSKRLNKFETFKNYDVIIFEGILTLYNDEINKLAKIKIFVDTPSDERFIRRFLRDTNERGRNINNIIEQWRTIVRPMYNLFVSSQKANADIVIPWYKFNTRAIRVLNATIHELLKPLKR
ncbi:MAG: uridine kinase [Mycoplasma sp.]|nr:uridine kinase [Mycoplasma sp.]